MKKVLFAISAVLLALTLASCEVDTSKVTVTVTDLEGNAIADRNVFYTDLASVIIGIAMPDPDAPLKEDNDDHLRYGSTNANGTVTFHYTLAVSSLVYYFFVYDEGSNEWLEQSVKLIKGYNSEITFQVNK